MDDTKDSAGSFSIENNTINDVLQNLRKLDEKNNICADCDSTNVAYGCITYGLFLCMDCAMNHKSNLNINDSKIKSLDTPYWSNSEILMMKVGGNYHFINFINQYDIPKNNPDIKLKYLNKAVDYYKRFILSSAEGIVINEKRPSKEEGIKHVRNNNYNKNMTDKLKSSIDYVSFKGKEICDQIQRETKELKVEERIDYGINEIKYGLSQGINTTKEIVKRCISEIRKL